MATASPSDPLEGRKEACKTYIEQTKLLVTLASAFLVAPVAIFGLIHGQARLLTRTLDLWLFAGSEVCFVLSVLLGYVVLGTVAGSQDEGLFDVYRRATQWSSLLQIAAYGVGLILLGWLSFQIVSAGATKVESLEPPKFVLAQVAETDPFAEGEPCITGLVESPAVRKIGTEIGKREGHIVAIIFFGSADVTPLRPDLRKRYGTNAGLAWSRAECVKGVVQTGVSASLRMLLISAAHNPRLIGEHVSQDDRRRDRTVRVFVVKRE